VALEQARRPELPTLGRLPDVQAAYCAARVGSDELVGVAFHDLVTLASVMKVQVALTALIEIHEGRFDGLARVSLDTSNRTPGPVGMSLFEDPVWMSVRDLLVPIMTISDNVATDALIDLVGVETVNATTQRLGLADTLVGCSLKHMLDAMASEVGFSDYAHLARHDPAVDGPPGEETSVEPWPHPPRWIVGHTRLLRTWCDSCRRSGPTR
jgi:hypothetical protein